MANNLISIGLPTYNRAALLPRAIDSVLAQTYTDFELIIVDDGSTDNTRAVVASYTDPRIRYIRHETKRGVWVGRNRAVREAKGDYLAFQDSDDWWHSQKLAEEIALLQNAPPHVGAVYSQIEKRYRRGEPLLFPSAPPYAGDLLSSFLGGGYLVTLQAVLMRKTCIDTVGMFDESFITFGDAEFIIRFAAHYHFLYNPHVRAYLEMQPDSVSRKKKERLFARAYVLQKHYALFRRHPRALRYWSGRLARAFLVQKNIKKWFYYSILALRASFFRPQIVEKR